MTNFDLTTEKRAKLFSSVAGKLEEYYRNTSELKVTPELNLEKIREIIRKHNFEVPLDEIEAASLVIEGLKKYIVHTPHPRYYGLFNPRASFPSVIADLITATFNPQLAAWSHSPYASETENYLVQEFGKKLGYDTSDIDGVFATGGAEANLTAVLCALNHSVPGFANKGLIGMDGRPLLYCSSEAHHSVIRAARSVGIGKESVRMIRVNDNMVIRTVDLKMTIESDLKSGSIPFMIIGTAGSTGTGSIDDLNTLSELANQFGLWFHIDAAYGGAAILNSESAHWIKGVERADSITLDVHKWLSVPMSASMFITRQREILGKTFRIDTEYMPKEADKLQITDPYSHSIQWSRRFIGLKLYLSLLIFGWKGFSEVIWHQIEMGNLLRELLGKNGWIVKNRTPLPVVCFTDPEHEGNTDFAREVCDRVIKSGEAWISVYPVNGKNTLRACITNYATSPDDIEALVETVNKFRDNI
ncbi:MAG TPA: pyridoxal-dependent decarboxylase [Bacteroidales bacterium]|nr:pyridoxal-dependent decarboxylase [Bacteroidales bacterium]